MKNLKKGLALLLMVALLSGCAMKTNIEMTINEDKSINVSLIQAFDNQLIDGLIDMEQNQGEEEEEEEDTSELENQEEDTSELENPEEDTFVVEDSNEVDEVDDTEEDIDFDFDFPEPTEHTDEERWAYLESALEDKTDPDVKKERYSEGVLKGFKYTSTHANIDDVTSETKEEYDLGSITSSDDGKLFYRDGKKYVASWKYTNDMKDSIASQSSSDASVTLDMKFVVTLPKKAKSHNATSVSNNGKTLTWDLAKLEGKNIEFAFSFEDEFPMTYVIIGGIVAGVCVLVGAVVAIMKKKNGKTTVSEQPKENPAPVTPVVNPTPVEPARPVVSPTPAEPARPVVNPTPVEPTRPVVNPTPVEPARPVVNPTPAEPTRPVVNPTPAEPARPVVNPTPAEPTRPAVDNTTNNLNQ